MDRVSGERRPPLVSHLFDGGVLSAGQLAAIRLRGEELLSFRVPPVDEALALMSPGLARRVRAALEATESGRGAVEPGDGLPPVPRVPHGC